MTASIIETDNWQNTILDINATIHDAIINLEKSGLQIALILSENQSLQGVVTDGDVRRGVLSGLALEDKVIKIMNTKPIVSTYNAKKDSIIRLMTVNKIHQLPFVNEENIVEGIYLIDEMLLTSTQPNTILIMAGGKGTRLYPETKDCPKPMLKIGDKPMLEHIIDRAILEGFNNFIISINYLGDIIEEYFGDGARWNIKISYIKEDKPLGTAGALNLLEKAPQLPFMVINGDILCDIPLKEVIDFHNKNNSSATMVVRRHEIQNPFGQVLTNGIELEGFKEKPKYSSLINAGIYVLDPVILNSLNDGEFCDMPTLFLRAKSNGYRSIVFPAHESWIDIGQPDDLVFARKLDL